MKNEEFQRLVADHPRVKSLIDETLADGATRSRTYSVDLQTFVLAAIVYPVFQELAKAFVQGALVPWLRKSRDKITELRAAAKQAALARPDATEESVEQAADFAERIVERLERVNDEGARTEHEQFLRCISRSL